MPANDFHNRFSAEMLEENNYRSECDVKCLYTNKIDNHTLTRADGFLTYQDTQFKYPTTCSHQKTIILTMENVEHPGFDITIDTRPTSDITAGYYNHHEYDLFKKPEKKKDSPIATAFISNCKFEVTTPRLQILKGLLDLDMPIASFGKCLNTAKEPMDIKDPKERKMKLLAQHKFNLCFENSHAKGYITEKYWQALVAGTVPVVLGAPDIRKYQPSPNSIIVVDENTNLKDLAHFLTSLGNNEKEYNKMLEWKRTGPTDQFLSIVDDSSVSYYCRLCIKLADSYQEIKNDKFILIRERNTFYYKKLKFNERTTKFKEFKNSILKLFEHYHPTWIKDRPDPEFQKTKELNIYRIIYSGTNFQEAFFGDSIDNDKKVSKLKLGTKLEVIFT